MCPKDEPKEPLEKWGPIQLSKLGAAAILFSPTTGFHSRLGLWAHFFTTPQRVRLPFDALFIRSHTQGP